MSFAVRLGEEWLRGMTHEEKRRYLIGELLRERAEYGDADVPGDEGEQERLLRSLFNVRPPLPAGREFLRIQDEYLSECRERKGVTDVADLTPVSGQLYLWRGDITALGADAVVNAANSALLGCFVPCHGCIDNAIHTYAGVQLRLACARLMEEQGHEEPAGRAKITPAFNLPAKYVLHTVGPIVRGATTEEDRRLLAGCYRSCLELAEENGAESLAFCCISTGEFHFPNEEAAEIAIRTVRDYLAAAGSRMKVVFNVFKEIDEAIYGRLLR